MLSKKGAIDICGSCPDSNRVSTAHDTLASPVFRIIPLETLHVVAAYLIDCPAFFGNVVSILQALENSAQALAGKLAAAETSGRDVELDNFKNTAAVLQLAFLSPECCTWVPASATHSLYRTCKLKLCAMTCTSGRMERYLCPLESSAGVCILRRWCTASDADREALACDRKRARVNACLCMAWVRSPSSSRRRVAAAWYRCPRDA